MKNQGRFQKQKYSRKSRFWTLFCCLYLLSYAPGESPVYGMNYFGRMMAGGYVSTENFLTADDSAQANNFSVLSTRLYFKAYEIGSGHWSVVVDLRDKNDFFEKLNQQLLTLTPGNDFQAYQLYTRLVNEGRPVFGTLGRFTLPDAGGEFVDGAEVGVRWSSSLRTSIFGGLEPKRIDQTYVTYNPDSSVFGTSTTYEPHPSSWNENAFYTTAFVGEQVQGHLDRLFWYNNFIFQWNNGSGGSSESTSGSSNAGNFGRNTSTSSQLVGMAYLDFVPNFNIQYGLLSYRQGLSDALSAHLNATAIDVIEYSRRQGFLETLPSSPYREVSMNLRGKLNGGGYLDWNSVYGVRQADSLIRAELSAGPSFYRLLGENLSANLLLGVRRNFISNDVTAQLGGGYYSKDWEFDLNLNFAYSCQNYGATYHKWITEATISRYFSREVLSAFSLQDAQDERVQIWSGYFRLSLLFGQKDLSPIPETAPRSKPQTQRWRE